ncbi:MAG: adenosine kinase [Pseudomonadota bacterium]
MTTYTKPIFTSIGNACTDIVASVPDSFLDEHQFRKHLCAHVMTLDEIFAIKSNLSSYQIFPGGAGANVCHVISALGGESHFISKIAADPEGLSFLQSSENAGITCHFPPPLPATMGSTQVLALITPDGERTFVSFDGASRTFDQTDYDFNVITQSTYLYLDGYCYSAPATAEGYIAATKAAKAAGCQMIFNVGDLSLYETSRDAINNVLAICDSVICNRPEAEAFFGMAPIDQLARTMTQKYTFGAITDGKNGAFVFHNKKILHIPAIDSSDLPSIDTNGAGDHFAGGFIFGLMQNFSLEQAGHLGVLCAKDCLSHAGARPLGGFGYLRHLVEIAKPMKADKLSI